MSQVTGRSIDSAVLKLQVGIAGVGYSPRTWGVKALATPWLSDTVTWNSVSSMQIYNAAQVNGIPAPLYPGQIIEIDVTAMVQNWADGTFSNDGIFIEIDNYLFPNMTSLDAFGFESSAHPTGQPTITIEYR